MQFDEFRRRVADGHDVLVPPDWTQGRTVFGGLSAGLLCEAVQQGVADDRRLRYLDVAFQRPLAPDVPFTVEVGHEAAGRTVAVRSGRIVQDGEVRVVVRANFVAALEGDVRIDTFRAPELPRWDSEHAVRIGGPRAPAFTRHIDFRAVTGGLPFAGHGVPEMGGWMRFDAPPARLETAHLVCLIDSWPPVPISYYDRPIPMSSINWQIHLAEPLDGITGDDFIGYKAACNFFDRGYGSSSADIWAPDGRLLAKSFQTFIVFG